MAKYNLILPPEITSGMILKQSEELSVLSEHQGTTNTKKLEFNSFEEAENYAENNNLRNYHITVKPETTPFQIKDYGEKCYCGKKDCTCD